MFKKYLLTAVLVLLAACSPVVATPAPPPIPTFEPSIPVTGIADVQSIEIQIMDSQPIQVNAILRGQLPDGGCTTISSVEQSRDGNRFSVRLITTTDPLAVCTLAAIPFVQVVTLDVNGLQPGTYFVNVNGLEQSFELPARDASQVKQGLVEALNTRDYNALKALMGESFLIGYWQSEGTSNTPDQAIELFQRSLLNSTSPITADYTKNLIELLGTDPVTILGPDVLEASPLFTSGWGAEGRDEAILLVGKQPDGDVYWHGLLFAREGFEVPAPIVPQPAPEVVEIPTISILSAVEDGSVTIRTFDFPANTKFHVYMGKDGTAGVNGIRVDSFNSRNGGSFVATFAIPEKLHGEKRIAIRLESENGYYSYNWFENETFDLDPSEVLPTHVEYVMAQQEISIHRGPSKNDRIVGWVDDGDLLKVTGMSADSRWWRVVCPDGSAGSCWVLAKPKFTKPVDPSDF